MNRHEPNDDALEQATMLLREMPLPEFPADAIAKQMRSRIPPAPASAPSHVPSTMRIGGPRWMSRIAAVIAVGFGLVAIGWAVFRSNPVVAFAMIAERLHAVHAMSADLDLNAPGMQIHGTITYAAPGRFRVAIPGAPVEIVDMNLGKLVLLDSTNRSATVLNLDDTPSESKRAEVDWIEKLRNVSRDAGKPVGADTINGVRATKFSVMDDGQEIFVWSDSVTGEPIRIEAKLISGQNVITMTLDHLTLNPPIDDRQLSVIVPPGYATQSGHVSAAAVSESDLVRFFQEYVARTGSFPPSLVDFPRSLQRMMTASPPPTTGPAGPDASFFETVNRATRAVLFLNQLTPASDWHYNPTAKPGDGSPPLFWYRAAGEQTYRVIHADLAVGSSVTPPMVAGAESPTFQK